MSQPQVQDVLTQVQDALTRRLNLRSPRFDLERAGPKVSGSVISPSFRGMRDSDRQRQIWAALHDEYGPESVQRVGTLLAFTPDEWDVNLDSDSDSDSDGDAAAADNHPIAGS